MNRDYSGRRQTGRTGLPKTPPGFTLLEILVVMLIIGIISGLALITVDSRGENLKLEARRLASLLQLAQDEAVLNGREYALELQEGGYLFLRLQEEEWRELSEDEMFHARRLPADAAWELVVDGQAAESTRWSAESEEQQPLRLYILSSGELTPFALRLVDRQGGGFLITGGGADPVTVRGLGG